MKVILSIKPEFANKIFNGTKKFEFRRTLFKNKEIKMIIVYASAPISKVIGEFEIDRIFHEELELLVLLLYINTCVTHRLDLIWMKTS